MEVEGRRSRRTSTPQGSVSLRVKVVNGVGGMKPQREPLALVLCKVRREEVAAVNQVRPVGWEAWVEREDREMFEELVVEVVL